MIPGEGYVPTQALQKALIHAQGTCVNCLPQIEYLEELAKVAPELDAAVVELRLKHEHLDQLTRVGLRTIAANTATQQSV